MKSLSYVFVGLVALGLSNGAFAYGIAYEGQYCTPFESYNYPQCARGLSCLNVGRNGVGICGYAGYGPRSCNYHQDCGPGGYCQNYTCVYNNNGGGWGNGGCGHPGHGSGHHGGGRPGHGGGRPGGGWGGGRPGWGR